MTTEIKVGDKVRVSKDAPREFDYFKDDAMKYEVMEIAQSTATIRHTIAGLYGATLSIPTKYLFKVGGKEKEPKPKYKVGDRVIYKDLPIAYEIAATTNSDGYYVHGLCGRISESDLTPYTEPTEEKKDNTITIPVKAEIDDSFWGAYTADLAKEIAIKLTTTENPDKIGAIAAKVAKAVVEELKKK